MKKPNYTGILRRRLPNPLVTPHFEGLLALAERFQALADHYELDTLAPGFELKLALALARDHVEGFQINKGTGGAPPDPKITARDIALVVEVLKARSEGRTDADAYRIIAARARARGEKRNVATLRKRFGSLMNPKDNRDRAATLRMWRTLALMDPEKKP